MLLLATMVTWAGLSAPGGAAPALDFSALSEPARRELDQAMADEFCGCGAPHTLAVCVQSHPACRHSRRLAQLAAGLAERGATASELGVWVARYNLSFREARSKFATDDRMCLGEAKAKVTLVEFSDFECPLCGLARPILEAFVKERAGQVRLCYLPFPLAQHPNAIPAGQAALFARDHGQFWAVHDALFENQKRLSVDVIRELLAKAGLQAEAWTRAVQKGAYLEELEQSRKAGTAAGVQGTPALYLNGRKLELFPRPELLQLTVEDELEWQSSGGSWTADAK